MKAIVLKEFGPTSNLEIKDIATPTIKAGEVLVKVKAISINPVDVKSRAGGGFASVLKDFDPIILGWDIAGTVVASESPLFKVNDDVFGMVNFPGHGQAYAEYVAAPADQLALKPANISFEEAAAATLAALTAWQALTPNPAIKPGSKVLIHAASGGVGHYAVQIAKHLGAYVIGTSSGANKDAVLALGADQHIDYKTQTLKNEVKDLDFVLDMLGEKTVDESLEVIRPGGAITTIFGAGKGTIAEKAKAYNVTGNGILVHSNGADMEQIAKLLASGKIRSVIARTFAFDEMAEAHALVETGRTVGKVVVKAD